MVVLNTHTHTKASRKLHNFPTSSVTLASQIRAPATLLLMTVSEIRVVSGGMFVPSLVNIAQLGHKDGMVISEAKNYFFPICDRKQTKNRQFTQISSFTQLQILIRSKLPDKFTLCRIRNCYGYIHADVKSVYSLSSYTTPCT